MYDAGNIKTSVIKIFIKAKPKTNNIVISRSVKKIYTAISKERSLKNITFSSSTVSLEKAIRNKPSNSKIPAISSV